MSMLSPRKSFGTVQRKEKKSFLSHIMESLNPTIPVLPIGVFGRFWAVAYVCIGASPYRQKYSFFYFHVKNITFYNKTQYHFPFLNPFFKFFPQGNFFDEIKKA